MSKQDLLELIDGEINKEKDQVDACRRYKDFELMKKKKERLTHWREIRGIVEESLDSGLCSYAKGFEDGYDKAGIKEVTIEDVPGEEMKEIRDTVFIAPKEEE